MKQEKLIDILLVKTSRLIREEVRARLDGFNGFAARQKAREEKRAAKKRKMTAKESMPEPAQLELIEQ
jgi:hypothetical protein